jgi:hypothetical protein
MPFTYIPSMLSHFKWNTWNALPPDKPCNIRIFTVRSPFSAVFVLMRSEKQELRVSMIFISCLSCLVYCFIYLYMFACIPARPKFVAMEGKMFADPQDQVFE